MWRLDATLARLQSWDERVCVRINRGARQRPVVLVLQALSWLGNGIFWYALMLALLIADPAGSALAVLHMVFAGAVCTCCYKMVKHTTVRHRPFEVNPLVSAGATVLDRFSFPSGHTLHAVTFSLVALAHLPVLAPLLVPFTLLVALSRVVLGLHYPSDVLAAMLIGVVLAATSLQVGTILLPG